MTFGLVALLLSYGLICSPQRLLPAIQSPAKNKFPTTGCLSTWTFQTVQQIRQRLEWNPENETAKATQPNLAPTPADYIAFGHIQSLDWWTGDLRGNYSRFGLKINKPSCCVYYNTTICIVQCGASCGMSLMTKGIAAVLNSSCAAEVLMRCRATQQQRHC